MARPRRSVVLLCVALIALAAFLPGAAASDYVLVKPYWILLPDLTPTFISEPAATADEQPASLVTLLPPRAPPALLG